MRAVRGQDWSMIRGDTLAFSVEIEGLEEDLDTMTFTCRKVNSENILFQKTLGNGCNKIETGKYRVRVAPEDTNSAQFGTYKIDLQIELNSDRYTILQGTLKIIEDMTRD